MRVLLLGFGKIAYMPYMNFYLNALGNRDDTRIELIYWDRDGMPDAEVPKQISKAYKFEAHLEEQLPFKKKLKFFARYRSFALRVLRKNRYDRIIVLHTTPGLTLLDYLSRHYKGKYVLDFRDISYEYIPVYRKLVARLSRNAACTFVSSNAFRKFLPSQDEIYTIHNYLEDSLNHVGWRSDATREREIIRVSYWGLVRQVDVNKAVMDALGNDLRFELHYYGRMQQDGRDMEEYARAKGYENVIFHGAYMPEDRYEFALKTDLIHNIYDLGHTMGNAMGNKYYDGVIFEIPQVCTEDSHMGDVITERQVGITINLHDAHIADKLWNYYNGLDWEAFQQNCKTALEIFLAEQNRTKQILMKFFG